MLSDIQRALLSKAADVMWFRPQPGTATEEAAKALHGTGHLEPASNQFDDGPAEALSLTEKGAKAIGLA